MVQCVYITRPIPSFSAVTATVVPMQRGGEGWVSALVCCQRVQ